MPLTALDQNAALIVIDLQKGLLGIATVHPMDDVIAASARLATAFRAHALPVVLVNAAGGAPGRNEVMRSPPSFGPDWMDIVDDLDAQPSDLRVTKHTWGAFHGTALHAELQARAITQVFVVGVATSAGVESTARAAHEHGYNVVLVTDAMTDRSAAAHHNSVSAIFPKIGETTTTDEVVTALGRPH